MIEKDGTKRTVRHDKEIEETIDFPKIMTNIFQENITFNHFENRAKTIILLETAKLINCYGMQELTEKPDKISKEIEVNGKKFLLAHTVPEVDFICDYEEWTEEDYTRGEPDYEEVYFDEMQVITGHTPTEYIDRNFAGKIWMGNRHIAIDCGAVFGFPLGCLCLDTMEEFYV